MRKPDGYLHWSDLKHISATPREFAHKLTNPPTDTLAFRLGRHAHAKWLLDIAPPVWDSERNGRRDKRNPEYFEMLSAYGETILNDKEHTRVLGMVRALDTHPLAREIKRMCDNFEKALRWNRNEIECAGQLDMCGPQGIKRYGEGWEHGLLAELKSCESRRIEPHAFQRQGEWYHYPEQCTWYAIGNGTARQRDQFGSKSNWPQTWVISVESSGAYDVVCHQITNVRLDQADAKVETWLEKYKECRHLDIYPGHAPLEPVIWDANIEYGSTDSDD